MSVINTNITSLIAQQNLGRSQNNLATAMERLSSGMRINSAKDDAAGQAIANRMSSQITGLATAQRNANDGISVAQTAEGGLNQINDNLQRVRELTVQAANETNSQDDLESIQGEINQRLEEIDRISRETDFNGTKVLGANTGAADETLRSISIQVGSKDSETIDIQLKQINSAQLSLEGFNVTGAGSVANTAATENSLVLAGASGAGTVNGVSEYVMKEANAAMTSSAIMSNVADGDTITVDIEDRAEVTLAEAIGFAKDGSTIVSGSFSHSDFTSSDVSDVNLSGGLAEYSETYGSGGAASTRLAADLTAAFGEDPVAATVNLSGGHSLNILVDSDGKVTDSFGQAIYIISSGGETSLAVATDSGGALQATATTLANLLVTSGGALAGDSSTVVIGDITYTADSTASGGMTITGQTWTADEFADRLTSDVTFSGSSTSGLAGSGTITAAVSGGSTSGGSATVGGNQIYITDAGDELTTTQTPAVTGIVTSAYTYDADEDVFTHSEVFDDTTTTSASGALTAALTASLGETVTATVTVGGSDTNVVIGSDGYIRSEDGNQLFIDDSGDLSETQGSGSAATVTLLVEFMTSGATTISNDGVSVAINGGATYTMSNSGGTVTAAGLTKTAAELTDLMSQNTGISFDYVDTDNGDGVSQTVNFAINSSGEVANAEFTAGAIASGTAYVAEDGSFTANATEDTSYFVQENGNVTNDSGQRIYEDEDGAFTTESATESERSTLAELDSAIAMVDELRSDLGAIQNRMMSAIENLSTTETNISAARSRIEDANYAVEVANMTKAQILQQAGTSVLAQANQIPQNVLSLLG